MKKTQIVKLHIWDLHYLKDSKRKALEKAFKESIDNIIDYLIKKDKLKYSSTIYISQSPKVLDWDILFWIQALVNSGYKKIYKTNSVFNFWIK